MSSTTLPVGRPAVARILALVMTSAMMATFVAPLVTHPVAAATDVGYEDGSYSGSAPTGREPQSKLWFNDGIWWASMYSGTAKAVDIHRLNWATQTWIDTGVKIDERSSSSADTLWDGTNLFVVSAVSNQSLSCTPSTSGDLSIRVLRFSYDAGTKSYQLDSGFPVTIGNGGLEAVALAKDSTGTIWVTWGYPSGSHGNVFVAHSTTDTAQFVTPFVLPLSGANTMDCSDYSAIVAYNGKIGIMWSNQPESAMYFGIHNDGDVDTTWTRSTALSGKGWADNHVNVKSLQADAAGQVFAATKTSLNGDQCPPSSANTSQPLIVLSIMDGTGGWQRRTVSIAQYCWSRPLVVIDQVDRQVYVFGTQPAPGSSYGSGGSIMYKVASLDNPNFADGPGSPFIQLAADTSINNVTSTKQPVSGASGLVVLAADDHTHHYVHNAISLGADTTPPTVTATSPANGATNVSANATVSATFSEPMAAATITTSTMTLTDTTTSTGVSGTVAYSSTTNTATFTPSATLAVGDSFAATVKGGAGGVTDLAGNPLAADVSWSFATAAPDTTPPSVQLTSPSDGATVSGTAVTLSATASDNVAVDHVDFLVNGSVVATDTAAPYTFSWNSTTVPNGSTTIAARAVDTSNNPATSSATVTVSNATGPIFSDGFETGDFRSWSLVKTGGDGTATVQGTTVKSGSFAASLTESTNANSLSYIRQTFAANQNELTISGDFQVATQGGSSGNVPIVRIFDSGGTRRFSLYRQNGSGALSFTDGAGTVSIGKAMALGTWTHFDVHLIAGSGSGTVEVRLDAALVYSNASRTVSAARTLQLGNETKKQAMNLFADNISVSGPGGGPVAPDTTITGGPSGTVNSTSASFTFTSTVQGSTFACSLDGAPAAACTSPMAYSSLAAGPHTFTVAATANGLTDATPASQAWTIDVTPPTITGTTPADGATNVGTNAVVTATFSEPMASGSITSSTFTLFDTNASSAVAGTVSFNGSTNTATLTPTSALAAGHAFTATVTGGSGGVTDIAGNPLASSANWGFTTASAADTTPPSVTLTDPSAGATVSGTAVTLAATASDNVAVARVDFLVAGVVVASDIAAPYTYAWDSTGTPDGTVTIKATAYDTSGNPASDSHSVTVSNGSGGGALFSDGFESGNFFAWTITRTGGDGTATVQSSVVKSGSFAAAFTETSTSGSLAYARATLSADQTDLTLSGDFQVTAEGTSAQNVPLFRWFDSGGTRRVWLYRQSQSGNKVYINDGSAHLTSALLPLGTWAHFEVHIVSGSGNATVEVRMNGTLVYSTATDTLPALRSFQIGNDTAAQPMGLYVDNIVATGP